MENDNSSFMKLIYRYDLLLTLDYYLKRIGINYTESNIYSIKLDDLIFKEPKSDNITIKVCYINDLDSFGELKDQFLSFLQEGHILVAAFLDDEWIGYNWISIKPVEVEEFERYIQFDGAYFWKFYVKKDYRRMGVMKKIIYFEFNLLKNKYNKKEAYSITETGNIPNNKALKSYGFSKVGTIKYSRFFFWKKYEENIKNNKVTLLEN